jgi:hypothetical protein
MEKSAESSGHNEELETSVGPEGNRRENSWAFGRLCCSGIANREMATQVPILTLEPRAVQATFCGPAA